MLAAMHNDRSIAVWSWLQSAHHSKWSLAVGRGKLTKVRMNESQPSELRLTQNHTVSWNPEKKRLSVLDIIAINQIWLGFIVGVHRDGWPWGEK